MADYHLDYAGFREHLLNAPWMVELMRARAEAGKAFAGSIAPDAPPIGAGYRDAFEVESGTHGGIHHDRAYAVLKNTSDHALEVEFGTERNEAHHVLGNAMDVMGSGA